MRNAPRLKPDQEVPPRRRTEQVAGMQALRQLFVYKPERRISEPVFGEVKLAEDPGEIDILFRLKLHHQAFRPVTAQARATGCARP